LYSKDITDNFIALISHGITLLLNGLESATSGFSSSRASANNKSCYLMTDNSLSLGLGIFIFLLVHFYTYSFIGSVSAKLKHIDTH
jgi:hypothetical protein